MLRRVFEISRARMPSEERRLEKRFDALRTHYFRHYWTEVSRTIGADIEEVEDGLYRISKGKSRTFVHQGEVMLDNHLSLQIAGNKPLVNRLLKEQGLPVPEFLEYDLPDVSKALSFMQASGGNCVVKPANGAAGGRGVSTRINSKSRLLQASGKAAVFSSNASLLIEGEHDGGNYRLLYLDGVFIDAIRREAPSLTGDGYSTVRALVRNENNRRLQEGNRALSPLTLDLDARFTLADQGLSARYVAASGEVVKIKNVSNQYSLNENRSVKNSVHPSIIAFGLEISRVLGVILSGVDLMLRDHTVPLQQSHCRFNEINTTPGLHHHALISNPQHEVKAGVIILNYIFDAMGKQ